MNEITTLLNESMKPYLEMVDLRQNVSQLRLENKELARNLHLQRYVSKQESQRLLSNLRSENLRLQKDNQKSKSRLDELVKEETSRVNAVETKKKEVDNLANNICQLIKETEELRSSLKVIKIENQECDMDIHEVRKEIESLENDIEDTTDAWKKEENIRKNYENDIKKCKLEIARMQAVYDGHNKECVESHHKIEEAEAQNKELLDDVQSLSRKLDDLKKEVESLEDSKRKLEEECKLVRERGETDTTKHSIILNVLKDPEKISREVQTDSFTKSSNVRSCAEVGDFSSGYERGTIVRVMGLGENTKRKFGKDFEIRATSYSRHVNLNVKLNK